MKKRKRKIYIIVSLLLILGVLGIRGILEREIKFLENARKIDDESEMFPPDRIVSLAPNITEILYELGLGEKVVAVSNDCDYPIDVENKKRVGSFWQPSVEAVLACKPDMVITLWFAQQNTVAETLKRMEYRVKTLRIETIDELYTAIKEIGQFTWTSGKAFELNNRIKDQIAYIQEQTKEQERPSVLWVVQPEPLRVAGTRTFITELLNIAGAENAMGDTSIQYPSVSKEQMLTCKADIIIQAAMMGGDIVEQQRQAEEFWNQYSFLPAVKNERVYVIDPDMILRLSPRTPQGLEQIRKIINGSTDGDND